MSKKSLLVILLFAFLLAGFVQGASASPNVFEFQVVYKGVTYPVEVSSNSTITDFDFNATTMELSFNVTGGDRTVGFSNVSIPKGLLWAEPIEAWKVYVNESEVPPVVTQNATHTMIYFTYDQSTQRARIVGTDVGTGVDITGDGSVNIFDGVELAMAFGRGSSDPDWDPKLDLHIDGIIDIFDIIVWAENFGSKI